jgi:hypothetical protein
MLDANFGNGVCRGVECDVQDAEACVSVGQAQIGEWYVGLVALSSYRTELVSGFCFPSFLGTDRESRVKAPDRLPKNML